MSKAATKSKNLASARSTAPVLDVPMFNEILDRSKREAAVSKLLHLPVSAVRTMDARTRRYVATQPRRIAELAQTLADRVGEPVEAPPAPKKRTSKARAKN
jgi:hypothetical protein